MRDVVYKFHGFCTIWLLCNYVVITREASKLFPMVIIPGDGGNQLEAKLNRPRSANIGCAHKRDWFRIWLDVWQLTPGKTYNVIMNI